MKFFIFNKLNKLCLISFPFQFFENATDDTFKDSYCAMDR